MLTFCEIIKVDTIDANVGFLQCYSVGINYYMEISMHVQKLPDCTG
jgi:hypothetical protein